MQNFICKYIFVYPVYGRSEPFVPEMTYFLYLSHSYDFIVYFKETKVLMKFDEDSSALVGIQHVIESSFRQQPGPHVGQHSEKK